MLELSGNTSAFTSVIREDVEYLAADLGKRFEVLDGTTLLVTGGSGFLLSYLLDTVAFLNDHVLKKKCQMVCVDNLRSGVATRLAHLEGREDLQFLHHDVSRPLEVKRHVDWIVHGASIASPVVYRQYPLETIDANVNGTRHMLELGRQHQVRGMVVMSSSEIYGDPVASAIPTPEDYRGNVSCTGPRACYDESKRMAETLSAIYYRYYQVPVNTVRPFNIYGPGQRLDDRRVIPDMMSAVLRGGPIVLFSDGRATRSFCYIRDAIAAIWRILLDGDRGEPYNVGNDQEEISVLDLAERMKAVSGDKDLEIQRRASHDPHYTTDNPQRRCPDLTKIRRKFPDWSPKVSLDEGLACTLRSYREVLGLS